MFRSVLTGTGCYIPSEVKRNDDFALHHFFSESQAPIDTPSQEVAQKFKQITGIEERRYLADDLNASDIATIASRTAIADSGIDPETLDQIIVAHNFGNVNKHSFQMDAVPSLAARVKHDLGVRNPSCIPYDILFGCPGWLQALIHVESFFRSCAAKRCLIIGTETLSRVLDEHDRDSMIFSDGAGACVVEYKDAGKEDCGILGFSVQSHSIGAAYYIYMGASNLPGSDPNIRYLKMKGRKVYEYAIKHVPEAMKECLEKSSVDLSEVKKIFIHQANEKMDEAIVRDLYKLYGYPQVPVNIMPMSIHWLGNSSVATIPTLYDMVRKGQLKDHVLNKGDIILFASVGAGMNINAICYRY
jgi:3-oxoacyl-[acyl-carrier-protein] synthase-3